LVLWVVKSRNFQEFSKAPRKTKEKLRKNGKFYAKSILVFGVTLKK